MWKNCVVKNNIACPLFLRSFTHKRWHSVLQHSKRCIKNECSVRGRRPCIGLKIEGGHYNYDCAPASLSRLRGHVSVECLLSTLGCPKNVRAHVRPLLFL